MRVTIFENEGWFDVHSESGHLLNSGFATEQEAVLFCKKNNLQIIDIYFLVK